MTTLEYVNQRLAFYDSAASRNHISFHGMKAFQIIAAASIPILSLLPEVNPIIPASVGALVAISVGLEEVFRFHEKWLNYRSTCELLRIEVMNHDSDSGPYRDITDPHAKQQILAERTSELARHELQGWRTTVEKAGASAPGGHRAE